MTTVDTAYGRVRGRVEGGVSRFLGIPYAEPPTGELRLAAPRPSKPWSGVRDALEYSPVAPQLGTEQGLIGRVLRAFRGRISEDCLYLNVWTPSREAGPRPVVVYLHGGAFVLGAGSTFLYEGTALAARGLVIVTLNYRLGALGFLDLSGLTEGDAPPANLGLRDQRLALDWVHENISAFGGDPRNVTLYGESAGAMSVGAHLAMAGPRRFHRAILSSGALGNVSEPSAAKAIGARFLSEAGVEARNWRELRKLPTGAILKAQRRSLRVDRALLGQLPWQPSLDSDLLAGSPIESVRQGSAKDVSLLIGTNLEEWKLFTLGALHLRWMTWTRLERRTARLLEVRGFDPARAGELVKRYREAAPDRTRPYDVWVALRTDEYFRQPAVELATAHAESGGSTFLYRFDQPSPIFPRTVGSCHGIELPLVFGTYRRWLFFLLYGRGKRVSRVSDLMGRIWTSFATGGRPETPGGPDWPPHSGAEGSTVLLTARGAATQATSPGLIEEWNNGHIQRSSKAVS